YVQLKPDHEPIEARLMPGLYTAQTGFDMLRIVREEADAAAEGKTKEEEEVEAESKAESEEEPSTAPSETEEASPAPAPKPTTRTYERIELDEVHEVRPDSWTLTP